METRERLRRELDMANQRLASALDLEKYFRELYHQHELDTSLDQWEHAIGLLEIAIDEYVRATARLAKNFEAAALIAAAGSGAH